MKQLKLSFAIAFLAFLGFTSTTFAQSTYGVKAGLTYMTLGSATENGISVNYDFRPGLQVGFFSETVLSESVVLNSQVLYTQKGANLNTTINGVNIKGSTTVHYIDVPLLVGFKANPKLTFYVGPQVSFLLSTKSTVTAGGQTSTNTDKSFLKSTMIGGNLGAGYDISDKIGLHLNYVRDFSDAAKKEASAGEKNSGFILTLGVKF